MFFVKLNISWIELLVAKRHLYNGQNNHICRCGTKQKNEFDIYVVTIMCLKAAYSVTMNIFRKFLFSFKSFAKVELSYVFTIKMFSTAESARKSELSYQMGVFFSC